MSLKMDPKERTTFELIARAQVNSNSVPHVGIIIVAYTNRRIDYTSLSLASHFVAP